MTWYEAQQIYGYLSRLEDALEEWTLNRNQMQAEQAELKRLQRIVNKEICEATLQSPKKELLLGLFNHIHQCQGCIDERLKY